MELASTRIITDDVDALVAFYEAATGITAQRLHPLFADFRTPTGTLAIASTTTVPLLGDNAAEARANRSVMLDFLVDDVDATYTALRAAVTTFVNEPADMPWGNRSLLARDPTAISSTSSHRPAPRHERDSPAPTAGMPLPRNRGDRRPPSRRACGLAPHIAAVTRMPSTSSTRRRTCAPSVARPNTAR